MEEDQYVATAEDVVTGQGEEHEEQGSSDGEEFFLGKDQAEPDEYKPDEEDAVDSEEEPYSDEGSRGPDDDEHGTDHEDDAELEDPNSSSEDVEELSDDLKERLAAVVKEYGADEEYSKALFAAAAPAINEEIINSIVRMDEYRESKSLQEKLEKQQKWEKEIRLDPEFGREHLQESLVKARLAKKTFSTRELDVLLESTGVSKHPDFVRMLAKVGKLLGEDTTYVHGSADSGDFSAKSFYKNSKF